jgi:ABC-2 type transport system permease protein
MAKIGAVAVIEALQVALIVIVALLLGWDPGGPVGAAIPAILLATIAFSGLGLLLAGALRAEVTLAAANGLYLVLLLLGGMIFPLSKLPEGLRTIARGLPSGALSDALHSSFTAGGTVPARAWIVLAAWAVATPLAAARTFRWE